MGYEYRVTAQRAPWQNDFAQGQALNLTAQTCTLRPSRCVVAWGLDVCAWWGQAGQLHARTALGTRLVCGRYAVAWRLGWVAVGLVQGRWVETWCERHMDWDCETNCETKPPLRALINDSLKLVFTSYRCVVSCERANVLPARTQCSPVPLCTSVRPVGEPRSQLAKIA